MTIWRKGRVTHVQNDNKADLFEQIWVIPGQKCHGVTLTKVFRCIVSSLGASSCLGVMNKVRSSVRVSGQQPLHMHRMPVLPRVAWLIRSVNATPNSLPLTGVFIVASVFIVRLVLPYIPLLIREQSHCTCEILKVSFKIDQVRPLHSIHCR